MSRLRSSAPGKLVLSGEYAVLDGAPAISMAINRRAFVALDGTRQSQVRCPGLDDEADTRLIDCVRKVLSQDPWQGAAVLDTSAFRDKKSGKKFGIGSSAALCAALVRAFAASDAPVEELMRMAHMAHRDFQAGAGSGVDIATSIVGGLVEFCRGEMPRRLAWPDGLVFAVLWSGESSSTVDKLDRLDAAESKASRSALFDISKRIAALWRSADAASLVCGLRDYVQVLQRFDIDHDLGIFDAGHDALAREANSANVIYKPCGAGGGDVGIVLGIDDDAVRAFAERATSQGFRLLDMTIEPNGALLERTDV